MSPDCPVVPWDANHVWATARRARLAADRWTCQRCHAPDRTPEAEAWHHFVLAVCPPIPIPPLTAWLVALGGDTAENRRLYFDGTRAVRARRQALVDLLGPMRRYAALEVHHLTPVLGRRSEVSCLHHQANLVSLCTPCHAATTREQRRSGLLDPA